jgi:hypothetical protein
MLFTGLRTHGAKFLPEEWATHGLFSVLCLLQEAEVSITNIRKSKLIGFIGYRN